MAFIGSYIEGEDQSYDRIENRRSQKAKAFREYVDAKTAAGEKVDPLELDRVRMSIAGGDPYLATYIPAGDALKELTDQANKKSLLTNLQMNADMAEQRKTERGYVQSIINENWDKSPDEMADIFGAAFGQDGVRIYDQFKPELSGMLSEATNRKYAELSQNPASKLVQTDDDLYRFFPSEMRNPKTAAILKTMVKDNQRSRTIDNANNTISTMSKTPPFVLNNPDAQGWWSDVVAQSQGYQSAADMPDGGGFVNQGVTAMGDQARKEQASKVVELASKDPYFAAATQIGDDDAIFAATQSIMVQAGMQAPASKLDPAYLEVKKQLDLIGKTASIATYAKKEAELKAAAIEEADAIEKSAGKRVEAIQAGYFPVDKYGNGKRGDDAAVDDRITQALNLLGTDPNFFPSETNIQIALQEIKDDYNSDKDNFDPVATTTRIMAEANLETKAGWVDRKASSVLSSQYKIPPGTNFKAYSDERVTVLRKYMSQTLDLLSNTQTTSPTQYSELMNKRAVMIQQLRSEIDTLSATVDAVNNDPAMRSSISNFDYSTAAKTMLDLKGSLKALEGYVPQPPYSTPQYNEPEPQQYRPMSYNPAVSPRGAALDYFQPINYQQRSGLDDYLDTVPLIESGGDPFAKASTSSATGLYQFTQGTWNSLVQRYGQQYGITRDDIYNPRAQRLMAAHLTHDNAVELMRKTGRKPAEKDLYLAHFLGPSGAAHLINNLGSNHLASDMFPDAAKANKSLFYKDGVPVTIEQLYRKLGDKFTKNMKTVTA